jgi:RsmE family RNA methyltransferase
VLRVKTGDEVRVGLLGGLQGKGEVVEVGATSVKLRCQCNSPSPQKGRDTLLLAFARPKVLLRCLEHAAALGFGQIVLFRCRRVEKSHLESHALERATYEARLLHGLEQSRRTHLPQVTLVPRFRELIEDQVEALLAADNRFVADPDAAQEAALAAVADGPISLVIGPEGGLSDHELSEFQGRGFSLVRAGHQPLRVETALAYLTGHVRAARQQAGAAVLPE